MHTDSMMETEHKVRVTVTLYQDQLAWLQALAQRYRTTLSGAVRIVVAEGQRRDALVESGRDG